MGVAFFSQNSQLLTFSLPTKEIFSCSRPKSACGKSFTFHHYPGQGPDFRFFFSYFILLPLLRNFEWQCLLEIRIFLFILAAVIRENLDMRPWIDLIQLIVILNRVKIIVILYAYLTRISRLFSWREILLKYRSLYDDFFSLSFLIKKNISNIALTEIQLFSRSVP